MIPELLVGFAVACALGVPLAIIGALVAELAEHGRRRKPAPPWRRWARPLADRARRLRMPPAPAPATWERIRAGMRPAPRFVDTSRTLAEMAGPIVTEAEVADEFERMPLARPTYYPRHDGSIVVGERNEVLVRPVNGRDLGTRPRRTPWPSAADPVTPAATDDAPPWSIDTTSIPVIDDAPAYGVDRCELDVAEAERTFALALGPDGCEAVS